MDGKERRALIVEKITDSAKPLSGSELSRLLKVSRQVIVGDIALLRAEGTDIIATNSGYIIGESHHKREQSVLKVNHTNTDIFDELCTIVDEGASVLDEYIMHPVYGKVSACINITNRTEAKAYAERIMDTGAKSLFSLSGGVHYHTIEASSQVAILRVQKALNEKGYLTK